MQILDQVVQAMTLPIVYENLQRVYIYVTIFLALHSIVAFLEQGALSIEQFFTHRI